MPTLWSRSRFRGHSLNLGTPFKKNVTFTKFGNGLLYLIYPKLIEHSELQFISKYACSLFNKTLSGSSA